MQTTQQNMVNSQSPISGAHDNNSTMEGLEFIKRDCPSCGSSRAQMDIKASKVADELPYNQLKNGWMGFFKEPIFFNYYRCADCGQLYNKKFFSDKSLAELYGSMPDNTAGQDLRNMKLTQKSYFDFLKKYSDLSGNYLEFGPDIGLFTENIAQNGNFKKLYLVEPNKAVHKQLKDSANNIETIISADLFDLSFVADGTLDLVVLIHVLDHMINPKEMMGTVKAKLKPSGKVLVVTHDERSLLAKVVKNNWPAYCLQHPHLFNVKSTKNFMENCGYEVIKTNKSYNYFPFMYLLQHLLYALGLGKWNLPRWDWLTIPLKLGNIITVAKVK